MGIDSEIFRKAFDLYPIKWRPSVIDNRYPVDDNLEARVEWIRKMTMQEE